MLQGSSKVIPDGKVIVSDVSDNAGFDDDKLGRYNIRINQEVAKSKVETVFQWDIFSLLFIYIPGVTVSSDIVISKG